MSVGGRSLGAAARAAVSCVDVLIVACVLLAACSVPNVDECIHYAAEVPFDSCMDKVHFCALEVEGMRGQAKVDGAMRCMVLKARCDQALVDEMLWCLESARESVE